MTGGMPTDRAARTRGPRVARMLAGLTIAAMLAIPATAIAAKGGGTSTPAWIALDSVSGASLAATQPRLGSDVKFATGYSTNTKNPWVSVSCYQDGALVYGEGNKPSADFVLGGAASVWLSTGGAATCRAELGDLYWRGGHQYYTYLAHTDFDAAG